MIIGVTNKGGFIARFTLDYTTAAGPQKYSSGNIPPGSTASTQVPGDAAAIGLTVEEFTGFNWTNPAGCTRLLHVGASYAFTISGTTFDAACAGGSL